MKEHAKEAERRDKESKQLIKGVKDDERLKESIIS